MRSRILDRFSFAALQRCSVCLLAVTVNGQVATIPNFNYITVGLPGATNALASGRYVYDPGFGAGGFISPGTSQSWTNGIHRWINPNSYVLSYVPTGEGHIIGNSVWSIYPAGGGAHVNALSPIQPAFYGTNFGGPWQDDNGHAYSSFTINYAMGLSTAPVSGGGWDNNANSKPTSSPPIPPTPAARRRRRTPMRSV